MIRKETDEVQYQEQGGAHDHRAHHDAGTLVDLMAVHEGGQARMIQGVLPIIRGHWR